MDKVKTVATSIVTYLTLFSVVLGALAGGVAAAGWDDTTAGKIIALAVPVAGIALTMAVAAMRHLATVPDHVVGLSTEKHQAWLTDQEAAALATYRAESTSTTTPAEGAAS